MKRVIFSATFSAFSVFAMAQTLPPVAQSLYDETYNADTLMAQMAINHGAQVFATPDSNSFYLQWFPPGAIPSSTPLIVTLHGSNGRAFVEFTNWYSQAQLHGCGIIALQWYRGAATLPPNDYFTDTVIYNDLDSALKKFNYPSGKAFLHGFSRGSARSYAIVFLDSHGGQNYFCATLSNAGGADPNYPLYAQIDSGHFGNQVFAGKQWALFCGGQDTNYIQSGCIGMTNSQSWLQSQGATVGIFIQDSLLGHDGFHFVPAYMDSVLNDYLNCYNGTSAIFTNPSMNIIDLFPNPFSSDISISIDNPVFKLASMIIQNIVGQTVYTEKENSFDHLSSETINLTSLPNGLYFLCLTVNEQRIIRKIVKQ